MSVTLGKETRERAASMIAEAGFEVHEPQNRDEAVVAYCSLVEGAIHFEEPEILRYCVPSYTGLADDEAARLAAVFMLRDEAKSISM